MTLKNKMVCALMQDCHAKIGLATANIEVLLNNPVGVGDHPNIIETIQEQLDIISKHKDRLNILESTFHEF